MTLTKEEIQAIEREAAENHFVGGGYASYSSAAKKYALQLKQERQDVKGLVEKASALMMFIEPSGKPVDGFRFREIAIELKQSLNNYTNGK